jgi:hypothetical protein
MITIDNINQAQLKQALQTYDKNGFYSKRGDWEVVVGGYDMEFALNYKGQQVVSCVDGELQNDGINESDFDKILNVIKSVYVDIK